MKNKRSRTPVPSRRKKALKRIAIFAVAALLVTQVLHIGLLFPVQAIWQLQEREGTGWTRVVERDWAPEIHKTHLVYLTENENATLFGSTYLTFYGWMACFGVSLDCTEEAPIYAGYSMMSREDNEAWYFFGRVDDPNIVRVEISLCAEEYDEMSHAFIGREVRRVTTAELEEQSGRRYFLVQDSGEWDSEIHASPRPVAIGYDEAGSEVARLEIERGNHSSFG